MMNSKQRQVSEVADKLAKKLPTFNLILVIAAFVGLALKMSGIPFGTIILVVSLLSMAGLNTLMAYTSPKEGSTVFDTFIFKAQSIGSSVTIVGLLYLLLSWPGYSGMLTVGGSALLISIIYFLYKNQTVNSLLKPIILLAIALVLYFTPKETLQNLHIISNNVMVK